ncbi:MAG: TRAP transporter small permease [Rhizobiaceae bacterium]|jgi:TRAP-type C4-dicarboxylate transport system permease small subunit|nr:TRAP transporter small permease [Rhizobiaceae bacterium]
MLSENTKTQRLRHPFGAGAIGTFFGAIACIFLFVMMLVTFMDVIGRYFFYLPLPAAYEIVSLLMPGVIFCALPITCLREDNVTVDILDNMIPDAVGRIQRVIVNLISAGVMALVTWRLWIRSVDQRDFSEVTDALLIPLWPVSLAMCALSAIATLAIFIVAISWATSATSASNGESA